jgi:O-acetyl-ADP-ribose deacetylase
MINKIVIIRGDITEQAVEAIVNAANTSLLGGGGVDGAIHRAAGPELLAECETIGGCPTGEARLTKGYKLPAKYIIHTVGPFWCGGERVGAVPERLQRRGKNNEVEMLARCYRSCFALASKYHIKTIAFPSISTGAYRFPVAQASIIALNEIEKLIKQYPAIKEVRIVCYDEKTYSCYQAIMHKPKIATETQRTQRNTE